MPTTRLHAATWLLAVAWLLQPTPGRYQLTGSLARKGYPIRGITIERGGAYEIEAVTDEMTVRTRGTYRVVRDSLFVDEGTIVVFAGTFTRDTLYLRFVPLLGQDNDPGVLRYARRR